MEVRLIAEDTKFKVRNHSRNGGRYRSEDTKIKESFTDSLLSHYSVITASAEVEVGGVGAIISFFKEKCTRN